MHCLWCIVCILASFLTLSLVTTPSHHHTHSIHLAIVDIHVDTYLRHALVFGTDLVDDVMI